MAAIISVNDANAGDPQATDVAAQDIPANNSLSMCAHVHAGMKFSTFFAMALVNWEVVQLLDDNQRATVRDVSGGLDPKIMRCEKIPKPDKN